MPERRWTRLWEWQHKTATKQKREPLRVTSGLYFFFFAKNDTGYLTLESNNRKVTTCNPGYDCKVTVSKLCLRSNWFGLKVCSHATKFSPSPIFSPLLPSANKVAGKVMFSQACVKNSVHREGEVYTPLGRHPCSPGRRLLQRTVRILLEYCNSF